MANLDIVYEPVYNSETHKKEAVTPLTDEEIRDLATSQSGLVIYESNFQLWDTLPDSEDFRTLIRALLKYSHEFEAEKLHATDAKMDAMLNAMYRAALPAIDANFKKLAVFTARQKTRGRLGGKTRGSMKGAIKGNSDSKQEPNSKAHTIGEVGTLGEVDIPTGIQFVAMFADERGGLLDRQESVEKIVIGIKEKYPGFPLSETRQIIEGFQTDCIVCDHGDYEVDACLQSLKKRFREAIKAYANRTA